MKSIIFKIFLLLTLLAPPEEAKSELKTKLNDLLGKRLNSKDQVSMQVIDLAKNEVIFDKNAALTLIPASTTKLVTTAAALDHFGPEHTFETKAYFKNGTLFVEGGGDPFFVSERLWLFATQIARQLKAKGNQKITGGLTALTGAFDQDSQGSARGNQKSSRPYNALITELALNFNSTSVEVLPGEKPGKPASIFKLPSDNNTIQIKNKVKTVGSGARTFVTISPIKAVSPNTEKFLVTGQISLNEKSKIVYAALKNPNLHFLANLASLLEKEGISIAGPLKTESKQSQSLSSSNLIVNFESLPLFQHIISINRYSNNFMTDVLYKNLGASIFGTPGTFQKGTNAIHQFMSKIGFSTQDYVIKNGSGLTDDNRLSARILNKILLTSWNNMKSFPELLISLASGSQEGTTKSRFKNLTGQGLSPKRIRGKTGTLWGKNSVSGISGYTTNLQGTPLAYSIIMNRPGVGDFSIVEKFRTVQDHALKILIESK